jgi:hypothetical protein
MKTQLKNKRFCIFLIAISIALMSVFCLNLHYSRAFAEVAQIVDDPRFILYLPSDIDFNKEYPLVVAFSPSADAQSLIDTWKGVSEKHKWIIFASKEFRNGLSNPVLPGIVKVLREKIFIDFPVNQSEVMAAGFSGGGMCSYFFAFEYPKLTAAVISNSGVIHKAIINKDGYEYIRDKIAVFLVSPADSNYEIMKNDRRFLESIGWKTKWIEFDGGHSIAPQESYEEAAQWLQEQFGDIQRAP